MFAILNSRGESIYLLKGGDIVSYKKHPNIPGHSTLFIGDFTCGFYKDDKCIKIINELMEAIKMAKKGYTMRPDDE